MNYNKVNQSDSSKDFSKDSLQLIASTSLLPVDSSARVRYFKYVPEYSYGTKLQKKTSPLLLENASSIKDEINFDSSGNVLMRETFLDEDIKSPLVIPLEKYLTLLSQDNLKNIFAKIVSENFRGNTQDDLSNLFGKFTDITIPLPFKSETIFGPPTINLKINGAVDITASYQNNSSEHINTSGLSNSNNSINFKQEVQLTAKGKIGDKLTIEADYNTQRLFDFENQLKIKYEGYADEVIKKIEAGNVALETRSGLIGSSQALFGVKGEFQLGDLSLSAVVSQKKSKTEVKEFNAGVQEQSFDIKVWNYSDNHYFLDTIYKESFLDVYDSITTYSQKTDSLSVDEESFEVWIRTDVTTTGYRKAALHVDLGPLPPGGKYNDSLKIVTNRPEGLSTFGIVRKLEPTEYFLERKAGYVYLKLNVPENYFLGVAYKRTKTREQFGTISRDSSTGPEETLILKMIKVENLTPDKTLAWEHKMKNIYKLPLTEIVQKDFECNVEYQKDGVYTPTLPGINIPLIRILSLDKFNSGITGDPDGKFDYIPDRTIEPRDGFVIFPSLKPFLTDLKEFNTNGQTIDSSFWYPQIYTNSKTIASQLPNANNYRIIGNAKGEAGNSNTINLGFNIVQSSVVLKDGGTVLSPVTDYVVDYSTGTVTIKNASALLSPDLKISYETNDLFNLASKTFIGLRGDYEISGKSSIGFTFVNLKQENLNDKVRLGEEPTNNSIFGIDFSTEFSSKFLTNIVNLLPGYNTKETSSITLRGEVASINPDPNTKKSKIPQDNNQAVAYIDDMEGVKKVISLGTTYNSWTMSSVPLDNSIGPNDSLELKHSKRGKLKWYNINNVNLKDIYKEREVTSSQQTVAPLYITFDPTRRGTYNYNGKYHTIPDKSSTWNGVMKYINTTSNDLVNENINFIEFSMRTDNLNDDTRNGKLIIDLGSISQDAIPNRFLDTEDSQKNGTLKDNDDLGLDFKTDEQEAEIYDSLNVEDAPPDPALDNFNISEPLNLETINGTQNNRDVTGQNGPDREDLDKSTNVNNPNEYFQYEINLDPVNNPYIVGTGNNGWRQYKIPLSEYTKSYGNAVFTNVRFVRMWITGVKDTVTLNLYDINLTGNQWIKPNKNDTSYNITAVSIEENSPDYQSPVVGDVLRQTIKGPNNTDTKSNEQSLSLEVFNITNGVRKAARKDFSSAPLDLFNYREMKLFVNGDPSFNYTNEDIYDAAMIIRFGNDSTNYYEYRAPIHNDNRQPEQGTPWNSLNNVTIKFDELTKIKLERDSTNEFIEQSDLTGPPGAVYRVFGNPDLKSIREIILGVEKNRSGLNSSISGSVWFNELRLVNVIDDNGFALNVSANIKLADLLDFNFALSKTDPFFHSLDGRFGSRNTGLSWDFSTTVNAHKFINNAFASLFSDEWSNFLTLPITFRHSESMINPKYFPGTDIDLEKAAEVRFQKVFKETGSEELARIASENLMTETQSLIVRNNISVNNMSFNFPTNNYFVKNIFNKINFNFNADFGNSRDLTYERKSDFNYNGGISISTELGLNNILNLNLGNLIPLGEKYKNAKLYFFLPFIPLAPLFSTNFNASTNFNRARAESKQRKSLIDESTYREFRANRSFKFDWKFIENWIIDIGGNYDFQVGSDLTPFETDASNNQRPDNQIFDDIFFNNGLVNFGKDMNYRQSITINPKFNFPFLDRFLTLNTNYAVIYGWENRNQTADAGYNTGYSNTITSSANLKLNEVISLFGKSDENNLKANGNTSDTIKDNSDNKQSISNVLKIFSTFIPNDINISFSQNNIVANAGVTGLPGFGNFWLYPTAKDNFGPSRLYQLGFSLYPGTRARNVLDISDSYTQNNELSFQTILNPILPEAITMELNFRANWQFTNNLFYSSNEVGEIGNPTRKTGSLLRGNSMFLAGDIENFSFQNKPNSIARDLSNAFKDDIVSFPFPNWTMTIKGIEKLPFFRKFANSITLENSFKSEYEEKRSIGSSIVDIPNSQNVIQAFIPLIGLNFDFKDVLGGNLNSTFKLNKGTTHRVYPDGAFIQTMNTNEWSVSANYAKTGFNIPLFGLSFKNDVSFALTLSRAVNKSLKYEFGSGYKNTIIENESTVITINPSLQYSISSKVALQLFYKYIKTLSYGQVPRTTNEGGLNIRISIQ